MKKTERIQSREQLLKGFCLNRQIRIIFVMILLCLPSLSYGKSEPAPGETGAEVYDYKKRDKESEQKKFVVRLKTDKQKIDFAIKNTKGLIEKSRDKPYLPELYLRLAELYIEKSRIVYFLRTQLVSNSIKALDHLESNSLKNQAIEIYRRILDNFPDFEYRAKVHFFMAHEFRELGQVAEMIKHYRAITKDHKESSYAPEAFLLLGDFFFNKNDPDNAQKHYESVFNYPESSAIAIARYKLGWSYINKPDFKKAIKLFEESVTSVSSSQKLDVDTYKRVDIKLESLIDMAFCYAEVYKKGTPQQAIDYFKKYAWSRSVLTIVLEKMAYRFLIKKKWEHSAALYRHLASLQQDPDKLLEYARNIFECVQELDTFKDADRDMAIIIKALEKQRYSVHLPDEEKEKNVKEYELYARDIVTHLHKKARKEASLKSFRRAADAYKIYLAFFTESPEFNKMELNYAEALFSAKEYLTAGKYYERLAPNLVDLPKKHEKKLYSAVVSYYNALKETKELNYYQTLYAREGLKATGNIFIKEFAGSERVPNVMFNIAWVIYDSGKHDDAIREFKKFVELYPARKEAKAAIHLILDIYHSREKYEDLINYGKIVLANSEITDSPFKKEVATIVNSAESRIINSLAVVAVNDWDKGRSLITAFARDHKASRLGQQALYALIPSSKAKGDYQTLFSVGDQIITQYPQSEGIEETLNIMLDVSLKASQYRLVAQYLESFAEILPKHASASDFLYQAGQIRDTLGQYDQANKNYQLLLSSFNSKSINSKRRAEIIFALADNAGKMGDRELEMKILMEKRDALTSKDQVKADARIANYYFRKSIYKKARLYTQKAKKGYKATFAKSDSETNSLMARIETNTLESSHLEYMNTQLKGGIDNKIVTAKAKLLAKLEKGYLAVIKYQDPKWAIKACYLSSEINREFARFLEESPLPPGLTSNEQKQYQQALAKKATAYREKAGQYQKTSIDLAQKWELTDPKLVRYYTASDAISQDSDNTKRFDGGYFSRPTTMTSISNRFLEDELLRPLHDKLIQQPQETDTLFALAQAYMEKSDFAQTILISQKILEEIKEEKSPIKARVYNMLGVCYLYTWEDQFAREAFKKALEIDPENIGTKINLSALLEHYGHKKSADRIYEKISGLTVREESEDRIHPHAKEMYYAKYKIAKK